MSVVLVGANPGLLLRDGGEVTAFASVWQVDWSERGSGPAIVLWHGGQVRLLGPDPVLSGWLADTFVRHFGEVAGLPWEPVAETVDVDLDLDLGRGLTARAADVVVEMSGVLDRRVFGADDVMLGGVRYALANVYAPCRTAGLAVAGTPVPGRPEVEETRSRRPRRSSPSPRCGAAPADHWPDRRHRGRGPPVPPAQPTRSSVLTPMKSAAEQYGRVPPWRAMSSGTRRLSTVRKPAAAAASAATSGVSPSR